jgi:hypothetical protein
MGSTTTASTTFECDGCGRDVSIEHATNEQVVAPLGWVKVPGNSPFQVCVVGSSGVHAWRTAGGTTGGYRFACSPGCAFAVGLQQFARIAANLVEGP